MYMRKDGVVDLDFLSVCMLVFMAVVDICKNVSDKEGVVHVDFSNA